jgi:hypothetical protein
MWYLFLPPRLGCQHDKQSLDYCNMDVEEPTTQQSKVHNDESGRWTTMHAEDDGAGKGQWMTLHEMGRGGRQYQDGGVRIVVF